MTKIWTRHRSILFFLLFCGLALLTALTGSAAKATPITGMVGVGTWNTQADFADVKVTQGTSTLYQSHFAKGMSEWKTLGGTWNTTFDGSLHQYGGDTPALALVGDPTWSNYTLTLKARKTGGAEGFLITFGSPGDATQTWWNIGGWGDTLDNLQVPGVWVPSVGQFIQTGVWYTIRIEVSGTDIRCYLNGALIHDTARVLDSSERQSRFQDLLSSPGFGLLNPAEQQWLSDLAGRSVYIGTAARATFSAMPSRATFDALTAAQQAAILRQVNRSRLTWTMGGGFGTDPVRDQTIIDSMDSAVMLHNQLGLFDAQMTANNNPGTPTADASYGGWINFGGQYNERTALHEISHALGTGTYWNWDNFMVNGLWTGVFANAQLQEFDGITAFVHGDTQHYWPYGLNYDNEWSDVNASRHVLMVQALRRDMGIATVDVQGTTVPNGTYVLVPYHAQTAALDVLGGNPAAGTLLDIHGYTGADSQKFLLDLQSDGTYRIRTALAGNNCIDLPYWDTSNGNRLWIWNDNGLAPQRWYLIPTGEGWYRIAPKLNVYKGIDVSGWGAADGTPVQNWDYLGGTNQQWRLLSASDFYTKSLPNGTYVLRPQHAPGSALDVPSGNTGNGTQLDIHSYTGAASQQFLFDLQSDGTYRIRTALAGNACMDLNGGFTTDGTIVQMWGDDGLDSQRWYVIPIGNGWYRIAAKRNIDMGLDVNAFGTADGTPVQSWDYLGGPNQLWKLTPPTPIVTALSPAEAVAGSRSFTLTVTGSNFTAASMVLWNGAALPTTFVSATQLTATIPVSSVARPAASSVTVTTSGVASAPASFLVAVPSLKFLGAAATRSGNALTVTVTLSNTASIGAPAVSVTASSLLLSGKTVSAGSLPVSAGLIPAGGTGTVILQFPGSGAVSGSAVLRLSGTYAAAGTFSTAGLCSIPR